MKTYGFGIIGCGMIADFHSAAMDELENGKLVAVSSRNPDNARRVADRYNVPWYTDYNEMLTRDDVDIVTICTPSGAHMEPAVAVAKAGKHIIVEKASMLSDPKNRQKKKKAYNVFTDFFKPCQPDRFDKTIGENIPLKNAEQKKRGNGQINEKQMRAI